MERLLKARSKPGQTSCQDFRCPVEASLRAAGGLLCAVLMLVSASAPAPAADGEVAAFTVKAAYLSKFGGFIRWPDGAFSTDTSPITICITGDSQVGAALANAARRPIGNRPVTVRALKAFSADAGCHILYAGEAAPERVAQTVRAAKGAGVLTVTDLADSGAAAPVINFVIRDNRVKFEIDEQAAQENGLTISSQLLGLAVAVKGRG